MSFQFQFGDLISALCFVVWRKRFVSINARYTTNCFLCAAQIHVNVTLDSSNQMKIFKEQGDKEAAKSINLMNATLQRKSFSFFHA